MTAHRVLVTGAAGFVGAHLTRHLVGRSYEVHALCRPGTDLSRLDDVRDLVVLHHADLRDPVAVGAAVAAARPERVFHLAAATMHGGRSAELDEQVMTNLRGSVALMGACAEAGVTAFVNVGDAFEYGPGDGPVAETAPCLPTSLDGITKLAVTLHGCALARSGTLAVVTLRPFSIVGADDHPNRLVPRLIDATRTGAVVPLSSRRIVRDFVWIDDMMALCLLASERSAELAGAVLNCGSGTATTLGDLVATVDAVTGSTVAADWGAFPVADHDFRHPVADATAARAIGWQATTPLATMIERLGDAGRPGQPADGPADGPAGSPR